MRAFVLVLMTVRPLVSLSAQGRPTVILDNHCFDSLPDSHQPRSCASISLLDLRAPLKEVRSRTLAAFAADSLAAEVRASSGDSVDAVVLSQPFDAQCLPGLPKESLDVRVGPVSTQFTTFLANRYRPIPGLLSELHPDPCPRAKEEPRLRRYDSCCGVCTGLRRRAAAAGRVVLHDPRVGSTRRNLSAWR